MSRVGFANAAGLLHGRGLGPSPSSEPPLEPFSDDEEEDEGAKEAKKEEAPMTEEEKEKEAERLAELFEKLNKTGIIQVMTPDMNPGQP